MPTLTYEIEATLKTSEILRLHVPAIEEGLKVLRTSLVLCASGSEASFASASSCSKSLFSGSSCRNGVQEIKAERVADKNCRWSVWHDWAFKGSNFITSQIALDKLHAIHNLSSLA
jgi:hypothetical protein